MVSRLLKSCATPPVSCPTASSFWDCAQRLLRNVQFGLDTKVPRDIPRVMERPDDTAFRVPQRCVGHVPGRVLALGVA